MRSSAERVDAQASGKGANVRQVFPVAGSPNDFIGRERELRELRNGLHEAMAGRGRLLLVSGEPGIGKTRLADEISRHAADSGAAVLWGRCWEGGGAPAYWPWTQIFRRLVREHVPPDSTQWLAEKAHMLAHLLPEMNEAGTLPVPVTGDAEEQRFRFFDAANTLVQRAAAAKPLVLVIDDLHAVDEASLLLLRFVARDLRHSALLVIVTFREVELRLAPGLLDAVTTLAREGKSLPLRGLPVDEIGRLIAASTGQRPSAGLVAAVHGAAGGNPFFVDEVVRLLRAEGRLGLPDTLALAGFQVPEQAREVVRRQLRLLAPATVQLLMAAAVSGQEFSLSVLERMTCSDRQAACDEAPSDTSAPVARFGSLADELGVACTAGVIRSLSDAGGRYGFAHALFRETLYDDLAPSQRAELHARAGEALEALYGSSAQPPLAQLAYHYVTAGQPKGVEYAHRTADDALHRLAYEEALHWYETSLAALDRTRPEDDERRLALCLGAGEAAKGASDFDTARREFQRAADLARVLCRPQLLAHAVLGLQTPWLDELPDETTNALAEEVLLLLDPSDYALRAQSMVLLARGLYGRERARALRLIDDAVEISRRSGDRRVLALSLLYQQFNAGNDGRIERALELGAEALALLAEHDGSGTLVHQHVTAASPRELALYLHIEQLKNHLWRGDIARVDGAITEFAALAAAYRKPYWQAQVLWMRALRASLEGRFREAEELAARATAEETRLGASAGTDALLHLFRALLSRERGDPGLFAAWRNLPDEVAEEPLACSALAVFAADCGEPEEAHRYLERAATRSFRDAGQDWVSSIALAQWAEVCAVLGDREQARALYGILAPRAELAATLNFYLCVGSTARYLGLLAATLGESHRAREHFEAALEMNARMKARPWLAHTQHDYAAMLLQQAASGEGSQEARELATRLAQQAADAADALGMARLHARAVSLLEDIQSQAPAGAMVVARDGAKTTDPESDPSPPCAVATFRRDGDFWTLSYRGKTSRLKHVRGMTYISLLLRQPGQEMRSTDLVREGEPVADVAAGIATEIGSVRADLGDAGDVIDAQARSEFKRRLAELREELAEAESFHDTGRAECLRAESDALLDALRGSLQLGGRTRRAAAHVERARVNVTRGVSAALRRIAGYHPDIAAHLSAAIKTGAFCSYQPAEGIEWLL